MERRQHLTSRVVLSQVFAPRARRGYEPSEVDAFLREIAVGVDDLNGEIDELSSRLEQGGAMPDLPPPPPASVVAAYESAATVEGLATPTIDTFGYDEPDIDGVDLSQLPEPPTFAVAPAHRDDSTTDDLSADLAAAEAERAPDDLESVEIVLRMAKDTAERALAEANRRADEIVADAAFRASEIQRDSDRKAFEAANKVKSELAGLEDDLVIKRGELLDLERSIQLRLDEARDLGTSLIQLADDGEDDGVVVDLTDSANRRPVRSLDD